MLQLGRVNTLVAIGAHPDDIEIAAGGLLLILAAANPELKVHYVLLTGNPQRQAEARAAAMDFLAGADITFVLGDLPDGRLPHHWLAVKDHLHAVSGPADLVLCPWAHDAHQDHRLLGELVPTEFRGPLVLQYEIPKWDGDAGRPNLYLPLTEPVARRKVELLHQHFPSQAGRAWFDDEVFLGLARLRGMECRARYAEAFHCTKGLLRVPAHPR